jgi:outer membrane protein assembly factor BamB
MSRVTDETPSSSISITCAWCGAEDQTAGRTCQICNRLTVRLPDWATHEGKRFKWLTRRHLIMAAVSLVILGFVAWMNYPFLPDPAVILFKRPITSLSSAPLPGQWSMVGWDSQLSRYLPRVTGYPVGRVLWTKDLGEPTRSAPTVADGVIYVGAHFKVLALDAETGNTVWELETNGPLHYSAAVAGTNLFVGMLDHRLLALDRKTGNIIWEFRSQGPITTSPLVANGIVYFGSSDQFIYALDVSNGNVIWKEEIQGKVRSSVAVYDGKLFASDTEGNLHILNTRTGQARHRFRTPTLATSAAVPANGLVYFPSGGKLYAVDANAREIPWAFRFKQVWTQFWLWRLPLIPEPPAQKGGLWLFTPDRQGTPGIIASPAVTPKQFYVGDAKGNFYAGDALSGAELWRFQSGAGILASPVVLGDRVYFGNETGVFYSLDRAAGKVMWQLSLGAPIEAAPVFAEGRIYVRTSDGKLHSIE